LKTFKLIFSEFGRNKRGIKKRHLFKDAAGN
jgi:hypothetical protein